MQTSFLESEVLISDFALIDYLEVGSFSINVGLTSFFGPVDFYGPVSGIPAGATGAQGPAGPAGPMGAPGFGIRAAATTESNGTISYSVGISSVVADPSQDGHYTYFFDAPITGGYAVSAQVVDNKSNFHANVTEQDDSYFSVLVTKGGTNKASNKKHSVIIVK